MIEKYIQNGKLIYDRNLSKEENISRDLFKIEYNHRTHYLLCVFDGYRIIHKILIS